MPPAKKTMISGRLVPNPNSHLTGFVRQKKSRIVIEIHSSSGGGVDSPNHVVRRRRRPPVPRSKQTKPTLQEDSFEESP